MTLLRPLRFLSIFALLGCLVFSGCQTRYKISGIAIALNDIQPTAASTATGNHRRAVMTLRFFNDNIMPVAFAETTHKLYLNGSLIGASTNTQALGIPPAGNTDREVFIEIDKPQVLRQLADAGERIVEYRLVSTVRYRVGNESERIPVQSRGQVDISALLR
ncbi:LEA type 2 family protein [Cephaloticoccus primus]|nr:LEA type 2 family protein [Cephaloticoccus primus]